MMSLKRLVAISRKEFHHVTRDPRTLLLVLVAPAFLLMMLAYVFAFDVDQFSVVVLDQDRTDVSRRYIADLTGDGVFEVVSYLNSYDEIERLMQAGRAKVALVIPHGVTANLLAGRSAEVQAVIDGVDSITGQQAAAQLEARSRTFSLKLLPVARIPASGFIDIRTLAWYNPSIKSLNSMVPGLIGVVLIMPTLALALAFAREKELGSFEGLASTPIRGVEYLFGKILTYLGFGMVSLIPILIAAQAWFQVPLHGTLVDLAVVTLAYFFASFGLAMLVVNFVKSQQAAMLIMILVFFIPSFFLTGLIVPIDTSSPAMAVVSGVLPASHYVVLARGVFLKGLPLVEFAGPIALLIIIGTATLTLSLAVFKKRIS
ncbi:Ribosome-associated ATPase [Thermoflexales bacterium]|nr:Ribosome-associated ATPase [Thermoflexales bacterium]